MLSKALLDAHEAANQAGMKFSPEVFVAGRNRLENEGASALAEVFATVKTFREIKMPQNSIFHVGIASLAEALLVNADLEVRRYHIMYTHTHKNSNCMFTTPHHCSTWI